MASRRRRKETSWGARPGAECDEERICDMRTVRPVRVARTSRCARCLEPVNLRAGGPEGAAMVGGLVRVAVSRGG